MYNNISYNKDYYTIEKLMNSRKHSVVYEYDNCMWLDIKNILPLLLFQTNILVFFNYDMPFSTRIQIENNMSY